MTRTLIPLVLNLDDLFSIFSEISFGTINKYVHMCVLQMRTLQRVLSQTLGTIDKYVHNAYITESALSNINCTLKQ